MKLDHETAQRARPDLYENYVRERCALRMRNGMRLASGADAITFYTFVAQHAVPEQVDKIISRLQS